MGQTILFKFTAEDIGVAKAQDSIKDRIKAINKEIKEAKNLGNPYDKLLAESVKLNRETAELRNQQKALNREFQATKLPTDSLAGMRLEYSRLIDKVKELSAAERATPAGKLLIKNAADVRAEISGLEATLGRFTNNVGNYKSGLANIGNVLTGGLLAGGVIAGIASIGQKVVSVNATVSDSIADVAKAANASIEFVDRLEQKLEGRNTRTSIVDQLGIAEIGGKLGVAEQDLFSFVESVDVVNVALGDQFGGSVEQTTDVIGKLRNVLKDIKTDDIGKDITGIGNALNFLEAQGVASAGSIADFAGRIGGVGSTLGVSAGQILGVSATLDELSVNAERGSSGFIRILQRVAAAPEAFADAADVSTSDFKKLVNEDLFGAVQLFITKLNDRGLSNTELQTTLKDLKLNGVGTAEVVSKLGQNMELLSTRVGQATKTVKESSSVTQEFEKKNQTLGASLEQVSTSFTELLTNSSIGGGLSRLFSSLADGIDSIANASDKLFDFSAASTGASTAASILAASAEMAASEINKESISTEKNFNILRNGEATQEQRNQAVSDLVKLYPSLLNNQQLEAANVTQLNGLQQLATDTLRTQITERLKLRAKEQIEIERQQKQLRLIELEATPDRALLGSLTAGETLRNFGTIDPKKLRSSLTAQFKADIAQLDAASANVDQQFRRLAVSAEDNLSAAEQDALDLFRQFNEGGRTATKSLEKTKTAIDDIGAGSGKSKGKSKDKKAAEGSLDFLEKQYRELQDKISATPVDSPLLEGLIKKSEDTSQKIQSLKNIIEGIRNPTTAPTDEQMALELATGIDPEAALKQAQKLRDQLGAQLGGGVGAPETFDPVAERAAKMDQAEAERQKKRTEAQIEENKKLNDAIEQAAIDSASNIADSIFQIKQNSLERELNAKLTALDAEEAKALENAQGNAAQEAKIKKDFDAKRKAIEKKAAEERKQLAIKEALINIALSVTKALTGGIPPFNFILAGAATVAGLAQLAVINSQEFAHGGKVKRLGTGKITERQNAPRTKNGDTVLAYVKPGEMVLNEQQQSRIAAISGKDIFKKAGVPGAGTGSAVPFFASGGVVDFVPQATISSPASGSATSIKASAAFSDDQVAEIGSRLASTIATTVASELKVALSEGLGDANRRLEREAAAAENRQG